MKGVKLLIGLLVSAIVMSCTLEDASFIENKVYLDRESMERVVELPVSIHDSYVQTLTARVPLKAEKDIKVKFDVEKSLVAEYNSFYGEHAELLPSDNYFFEHVTTVIKEGSVFSPENGITFDGLLDLDPETVYVLPVVVRSNDTSTLTERSVIYYVFRRTGIVNVVANLDNNGEGAAAKVTWNDLSMITNPDGFTYEALLWCTFTSDGLPYDSSRKNYPEGHEEANIMCLMGADKVKGGGPIHIRYYLQPRSCGGGKVYWFELTNWNRRSGTEEGDHPEGQVSTDQFVFYPDRQWFHFAVTFDKASGVLTWYCDGKPVSTRTCSSKEREFLLIDDDTIDKWYIGRQENGNQRWWAGKVAEVRLWNRALSVEELNSDYHAYYIDPANAEGLAAYWKFNEGTGGSIRDHSGHGNHASVMTPSPILWEKVNLPEADK